MTQIAGIESLRLTAGSPFRLGNSGESSRRLCQRFRIDADRMTQRTQVGNNPLRRRIGDSSPVARKRIAAC